MFQQNLVKEEDIPKIFLSIHKGHYEYIRIPFGLRNAPATFQRKINFCTQSVVYLDDILIILTSLREHINSISHIFKELEKHNLKVPMDKFKFLAKKTKYLGFDDKRYKTKSSIA